MPRADCNGPNRKSAKDVAVLSILGLRRRMCSRSGTIRFTGSRAKARAAIPVATLRIWPRNHALRYYGKSDSARWKLVRSMLVNPFRVVDVTEEVSATVCVIDIVHTACETRLRRLSRRPIPRGDFDRAEEAMHDAFAAALERWARMISPC